MRRRGGPAANANAHNEKRDPKSDPFFYLELRPCRIVLKNLHASAAVTHRGVRACICARRLRRTVCSLSGRGSLGRRRRLFVGLRRDDLLAAVETGRADVVTTMNFTGRRFDRGRRIGQKVMSTAIAATGDGFLVLLNSHGKPHVVTSDVNQSLRRALEKISRRRLRIDAQGTDSLSNERRILANPTNFLIKSLEKFFADRQGVSKDKEKGRIKSSPLRNLERETSLELATSTLARLRSTN